MTEAETIIKLIEIVATGDTEKLDEIDARVYAITTAEHGVKSFEFVGIRRNVDIGPGYADFGLYDLEMDSGKTLLNVRRQFPQYTRSRDALKAIRPKSWQLDIRQRNYIYQCILTNDEGVSRYCGYEYKMDQWLKTEELAELHAIIQAIEYERTQS